jgi:hypothetical protein
MGHDLSNLEPSTSYVFVPLVYQKDQKDSIATRPVECGDYSIGSNNFQPCKAGLISSSLENSLPFQRNKSIFLQTDQITLIRDFSFYKIFSTFRCFHPKRDRRLVTSRNEMALCRLQSSL